MAKKLSAPREPETGRNQPSRMKQAAKAAGFILPFAAAAVQGCLAQTDQGEHVGKTEQALVNSYDRGQVAPFADPAAHESITDILPGDGVTYDHKIVFASNRNNVGGLTPIDLFTTVLKNGNYTQPQAINGLSGATNETAGVFCYPPNCANPTILTSINLKANACNFSEGALGTPDTASSCQQFGSNTNKPFKTFFPSTIKNGRLYGSWNGNSNDNNIVWIPASQMTDNPGPVPKFVVGASQVGISEEHISFTDNSKALLSWSPDPAMASNLRVDECDFFEDDNGTPADFSDDTVSVANCQPTGLDIDDQLDALGSDGYAIQLPGTNLLVHASDNPNLVQNPASHLYQMMLGTITLPGGSSSSSSGVGGAGGAGGGPNSGPGGAGGMGGFMTVGVGGMGGMASGPGGAGGMETGAGGNGQGGAGGKTPSCDLPSGAFDNPSAITLTDCAPAGLPAGSWKGTVNSTFTYTTNEKIQNTAEDVATGTKLTFIAPNQFKTEDGFITWAFDEDTGTDGPHVFIYQVGVGMGAFDTRGKFKAEKDPGFGPNLIDTHGKNGVLSVNVDTGRVGVGDGDSCDDTIGNLTVTCSTALPGQTETQQVLSPSSSTAKIYVQIVNGQPAAVSDDPNTFTQKETPPLQEPEKPGCGCKTVGEGQDDSYVAILGALGVLGAFVFRRRTGAKGGSFIGYEIK